jgi:hypothetical protein
MGEKYKTDITSTDIMSERIPLLEQIVNDLAFDFGVHKGEVIFSKSPSKCFDFPPLCSTLNKRCTSRREVFF